MVICRVEHGASGPLQMKKIGQGDIWLSTDGSSTAVCSSHSKDRGRKGGVIDGLPVGVGDDGFGAMTRRGSDESAPCWVVEGVVRAQGRRRGPAAASSSSCSAPSSGMVAAPSSGSGGLVADGILLLLATSRSSVFPASSPSFPLLFSFLALLCFLDAAAAAWGKRALGSRVCDTVEGACIGGGPASIEA